MQTRDVQPMAIGLHAARGHTRILHTYVPVINIILKYRCLDIPITAIFKLEANGPAPNNSCGPSPIKAGHVWCRLLIKWALKMIDIKPKQEIEKKKQLVSVYRTKFDQKHCGGFGPL